VGLKNQEAPEDGSITLHCELSKAGVSVEWWRGETELSQDLSGGKYQMKLEGKIAEMTITNVQPEDRGKYSCVTGDQKTTAEVKVQGKKHLISMLFLVNKLIYFFRLEVEGLSDSRFETIESVSFYLYFLRSYNMNQC
jgi:hypothetical protein